MGEVIASPGSAVSTSDGSDAFVFFLIFTIFFFFFGACFSADASPSGACASIGSSASGLACGSSDDVSCSSVLTEVFSGKTSWAVCSREIGVVSGSGSFCGVTAGSEVCSVSTSLADSVCGFVSES